MGIDIKCFTEVKRADGWEWVHEQWPFFDRNSVYFGLLGHRIGLDGLRQISPPRGLPPDLSQRVKSASDVWQDEYFYHSWLTLKELLDYDYDQIVARRRVITVWEDTVWEEGYAKPYYYAPENEEEGEWKDFSLAEELGADISGCFRKLVDELGVPEDIRVVFWFDQG